MKTMEETLSYARDALTKAAESTWYADQVSHWENIVQALERQVEKPVAYETVDDQHGGEISLLKCPQCGCFLEEYSDFKMNVCPECGQALAWEE